MSVSSSLISGKEYLFKHKLTKNKFTSRVFIGLDGSAFLERICCSECGNTYGKVISKKELEEYEVTHTED